VRATENPPALAAADVLGDRLQAHLELLADVLQPQIRRLEGRFLERLRRLGYNPRQRKALAAITPGAAAAVLASRRLPPDFIEQVEYNGRRLAMLNLAPARIVHALREYDRLLAPFADSLDAGARAGLTRALEQWYFCVVLTLNNAFYQVAETETLAYHELFRVELESKSLDELLLRMLQALCRYCRAEAGVLYLLDSKTSTWLLKAASRRGEPERCAAERVAGTRESLRRLRKASCAAAGTVAADLALCAHWRDVYQTCWSVPLALQGRTAGVVQFGFSCSYEWLPREQELLLAAAERCMLAAEKARLVEDLAAREDLVRRLAERMLQVEEAERRRISSELHDEAGQSLLCIRLQLELLERSVPESCAPLKAGLSEARALTEKTIVEIRRLISALSPAVLEELGLAPALRHLAARLRRLHTAQVKLRVAAVADVPKETACALYRLVQECLNNVARHSSAEHVNISVTSADGGLRLCVEDDGVGFRVEEALARPGSFGLAGMSERVTLLGGKFHVESQRGRGTRVLIELPIPGRRRQQDPGS
jgi:signal transduction histidine kinase